MDIKVNQVQAQPIPESKTNSVETDHSFQFTLEGKIEENSLQARLQSMMSEITMQGDRLAKKMDVRDMKRYRGLIKEFLNEVVSGSHEYSRENYVYRSG